MADLTNIVRPVLARLVRPHDRVVVGVSGGPDSQALLDVLARLKKPLGIAQLWAVGVDHGLRADAPQELQRARALAQQHTVPFEVIRLTVSRAGNVLAAARRARLDALAQFMETHGANRIALGHHGNDQVETILLNLARGAGLRGAAGMPMERPPFIRPLLSVSRKQIRAHLAIHGIAFAEDPSNHDPRRARAIIRAEIEPALQQLNSRFAESFCRFAEQARAAEQYLTRQARAELRSRSGPLDSLRLDGLADLPPALASQLVREWLARHGKKVSNRQLEQLVAQCCAGHAAITLGGTPFCSDRGRLWSLAASPYAIPLSPPQTIQLARIGLDLTATICDAASARQMLPVSSPARGGPRTVAFDLDHLHLGIEVRSWRSGDRLKPFGLNGRVKVGDLFTNEKVPRPMRLAWPIVTHGDDILWVVGLRRGNLAPLSSRTARALVLRTGDEWPLIPW